MNNSSTSDYIKVILEKENIHSNKGIIDATRGKHGGTWVHPMLFIDISMWINPYFKYDVVKFAQDEMIKFRNLAGDAYGYGMGYHYSTFSGWGNYVGD